MWCYNLIYYEDPPDIVPTIPIVPIVPVTPMYPPYIYPGFPAPIYRWPFGYPVSLRSYFLH